MPKNVIVVGMPRSGTSLTAAIFARQGYFLGEQESDKLRGGDAHNPFGYFEAQSLIERNAEIFSRVGFEYDNTWLYSALPAKAADLIPKLTPSPQDRALIDKYNRHTPWIWKDPRLCYTLGYWWQMLDPSTTAVLFIKRSCDDILRSFIRLRWREPGEAARRDVEKRSYDHWRTVETTIKKYKIPYLSIDYADYKSKPEDVIRGIHDIFGLALDVNDLNFHEELDHSTLKSKIVITLTHRLFRLPRPLWAFLRKLLPKSLLNWLFPEKRFE